MGKKDLCTVGRFIKNNAVISWTHTDMQGLVVEGIKVKNDDLVSSNNNLSDFFGNPFSELGYCVCSILWISVFQAFGKLQLKSILSQIPAFK